MVKKEKGITAKIVASALEIIQNENGNIITSADLRGKIKEKIPHAKPNTITGAIHKVGKSHNVKRPRRGLFRWGAVAPSKAEPDAHAPAQEKAQNSSISEQDFYTPCANYLIDSGKCTEAVEIGGNHLGDLRGTPDVMGVLDAPDALEKYNLQREIVSVEIKTDTSATALWQGFSQACAYAAFSNRSYLAVPKESQKNALPRLVFLCRRFGIGLILFDLNAQTPAFGIEVTAQNQTPDFSFLLEVVEKFRDSLKPRSAKNKENKKIKAAQKKLRL